MKPKFTNPDGDIFGGIILSIIDEAAAVDAQRQGHCRYVQVPDIVPLWCMTIKLGTSSLKIQIEVLAIPRRTDDSYFVTEAIVTMVAINENREPIPIHS